VIPMAIRLNYMASAQPEPNQTMKPTRESFRSG
jgi:hypothetical protein